MANLESKAILAYHLNRMKYFFPDEYNIFPKSWSLPRQWKEVISYNREHADETLILKPTRGAEGKGIKILNFIPEHEVMDQDASCQVYLSNVLLINGFKFDLRVYVLFRCHHDLGRPFLKAILKLVLEYKESEKLSTLELQGVITRTETTRPKSSYTNGYDELPPHDPR
ncbi:tubulin polyglutamylase TTLL6-like [Diaphorina citri]|uniref:Tubulin polyglutamylase TTLL6-like n=1 Tax=Diaphorina citri TaxID=121845 RepID=A0A1S4EG45_DIACI|nr:tubulin polyglutamylase TTLL6-like [Diaphorina citri]